MDRPPRDPPPVLGTCEIRGEVMTAADEAMARVLGRPLDALVGVPFTRFVVPADAARIYERHARRMRGDPVPDSYEATVVAADGTERLIEIHFERTDTGARARALDVTARARRNARLRALSEAVVAAQRAPDTDALLGDTMRALEQVGVLALLLRPAGDDGLACARVGVPPTLADVVPGGFATPPAVRRTPMLEEAWRAGVAFSDDGPRELVAVAGLGPDAAERASARGLFGAFALRVDSGGAGWGLLFALSDWPRAEDLPALRLFAAQLGGALERHDLLRDLRGRVDELTLLHDVAFGSAALDAGRLFENSLGRVAATLGATAAYGWVLDERGELVLRGHVGASAEVVALVARMAPGEGLAGEAVARLATVHGRDALARRPGYYRDRMAVTGEVEPLTVPLVVGNARALGAIGLVRPAGRPFAPREVRLAEAVAAELAVAVENARLYDDLRRSYASLRLAQERLVQRERLAALGELAAVVAHEVRNPLGVLFNSLGSLRRLLRPSGEVAMLVDIMGEESARLNRIVSDLLDFARPIAPVRAPESLERVLDEAIEAALAAGEPGAHRVDREVAPGLPLVPMDARMVRQAVINLVLNAIQATAAGGAVCVRASATALEPGRDRPRAVRVAVEDHGPGIEPSVRERIFEPFFTTKARGSGLGLVVVRRIVEAHRGRVDVASTPGRGTTFTISLPLDDDDGPATSIGASPWARARHR